MERVKGIEPSSQPWEGHILPLNHTRLLEAPCFYQICRRLATWFAPVVRSVATNRLIASRSLFSICFCRSGDSDFSAVQFAHIKTVNRRAAFGHDARRRQCPPPVRQTSGKSRRATPAGPRSQSRSACASRKRHCQNEFPSASARRHRPHRPAGCVIWRAMSAGRSTGSPFRTFSSSSANLSCCSRAARLPVRRVVDEKGVQRDAVGARENLRAQNVQPGGAQRTGDFAEQSGAVPGANFDDVVAAVAVRPATRSRATGRDCFAG